MPSSASLYLGEPTTATTSSTPTGVSETHPRLPHPRSGVSPALAIAKALPGPCPYGLWPEGDIDRETPTSFTPVVKPGLNSTF